MAIIYNKLIKILDERKITSYTFKKNNIVGQSAWKKIHENKNIDMSTLNALCKFLNCQPSELIEYVEDEEK